MLLAALLGLGIAQAHVEALAKAPRPFKRPVTPRSPPQKWVTFSQFPDKGLEGRAFGRVRFLLDVDAAGNVSACHILATSGFWILDEETCSVLKHRAHFLPALDADGKPAPATFASAVTWSRGDKSVGQWEALMKAIGEPVRVTLTAKKVPDGYRDPPVVRIRFDAAGKPAECRVELKSGSAAVDRSACAQVMAGAEPAKSTPLVGALDTRMFQVFFFEEFTG